MSGTLPEDDGEGAGHVAAPLNTAINGVLAAGAPPSPPHPARARTSASAPPAAASRAHRVRVAVVLDGY
ncbi:hypothetical protein [Streptomyces candidus]|uniref:Uncharacterized protein n=1 Tax=Streptomyces candidus TaxID=67283 RepID=A0A7X0LPI8_9ACTN|nr:hypothetical protein [Streptomyces candidus]MBB6436020.1 hypothetical protein [Streptomyces candidus]